MKSIKTNIRIVNRKQLKQFLELWNQSEKKKGVLIMGNTGTGKTHIMDEFCSGAIMSATSLVRNYCKGGMDRLTNNKGHYSFKAECIDDIGSELSASYFGQVMNLIEDVILEKYERKVCTHFTTNLNMFELEERYGSRIIDRLKDMCYILILKDTNLRVLCDDSNIDNEIESSIKAREDYMKNNREAIDSKIKELEYRKLEAKKSKLDTENIAQSKISNIDIDSFIEDFNLKFDVKDN